MNRIRTFASGTVVLFALAGIVQGCSSDSEAPSGSQAGAGGSGTGAAGGSSGSAGVGGASGSSGASGSNGASGSSGSAGTAGSAGSSGSGGTAGTGTDGATGSGGSSGTGTGGTGGGSADGGTQCGSGIRNNQTACTAACTGSICGLHDLGRRDCACPATGMYQCASCAFPGNEPILVAPTSPLTNCTGSDTALRAMATCPTQGERCQSITDAAHVCACWMGTWDCDDKPWE